MATSLADAIRLGEFRMSQMMACQLQGGGEI